MISVEALTAAVLARVEAGNTAANRVNVFDGVPGGIDWQGDAVAMNDDDKRAHPYVTVYSAPGQAMGMPLADHSDSLAWSFQTTCAGGDPTRARRSIDRVRERLDGHRLVVAGVLVGVIREPEFYTAGPLREDRDVSPSRWWVPLQWEVYAVQA